jgi:uncharacterized membrane protein
MAELGDANVELILIIVIVVVIIIVVIVIIIVVICDENARHLDHMTDVCGELYASGRDELDLLGVDP